MEPEGSHHFHKSPPLVPILSQMNPTHTFSPYFLRSVVILTSHLRLARPSDLFSLSFPKVVCISRLSHACYMFQPSRPSWFIHPNNIWWSAQVMKLLIMQSSLASSHFLPVRPSKYTSQHPVHIHPQSTFFHQSKRPNFTPIQNNRLNNSFVRFKSLSF
jgi:hypothetical protein